MRHRLSRPSRPHLPSFRRSQEIERERDGHALEEEKGEQKREGRGAGAAGRQVPGGDKKSPWAFDYYVVLCRKLLWQGKGRLRRNRDLAVGAAAAAGGGGTDAGDSLYQVRMITQVKPLPNRYLIWILCTRCA